jgi:hypothetical protein
LDGLAALSDKRAMELGFKYSGAPNYSSVRASAPTLLGNTGKDDPRTLGTLTAALNDGIERTNFSLISAAANALVALGDARGMGVFDEALKKASPTSQLRGLLTNAQQRLKVKLAHRNQAVIKS